MKAYVAEDEKTFISLMAMQPLVADLTNMPHMEAIYIPFLIGHGRFFCHRWLQCDDQNVEGY